MTGIVTTVNTIVAKGLGAVLTIATLERWVISFAVAFPVVIYIAPLATKITDSLIKKDYK